MKNIKITIAFIAVLIINGNLYSQIDTYSAEEQTYFSQLHIGDSGLFFSDNYSSGIYTIKNGNIAKSINGLGSGRYFTLSPDGTTLGYKQINTNGSQQAVVMNLNNGRKISLNIAEKLCGTPDFSATGTIAYSSGNYLIFGDSLYLGYHVNYIRLSPNGKYIAFADNNEQICIVNTITKETNLISEQNKASFYPKWSPESDKLVYSSGNCIFVYNTINEETSIIENAIAPSWFNNDYILFQRNDTNIENLEFYNSDIYIAKYDTSEETQLTNTTNRCEMNPVSDGQNIYFHTYTQKQIVKAEFSPDYGITDETIIIEHPETLPIEYSEFSNKADRSIVYLGPVPYVHQKYDTPSWHNGSGSCAPTTCVMAFAYYNLLPPWNVSVDHAYSWDPHTNPYGSYVADKYRFNEFYYDIYEAAYGTDAWGGYGFMWDGSYSPNSRQRTYITQHYLNSNQLWTSSCTFNYTKDEIDLNYVHPICSYITHSGHLTLAIGYVENQHTLIFNDPWGNKNTPGYPSYDGEDAYYDWPGYNNGYANLDADGTHGGVAWTTRARGSEITYNDTIIDSNFYNHGFYMNNTDNGSHQRYFRDANAGYNNHFWYTGTMNTTNDWCYVTWTPNLNQAADYEVFAYIPEIYANAQNAKYIITHDEGSNEVLIDQSAYSGQWVSLGIYPFSPSSGGNVYLGDNTGIDGQNIAFDAVKWSIIPMPLNITSTPVSCNGSSDGTATVTPTDNNPPYQYIWNTTPSQNTATATGLPGGNYTVTVTNGQGTSMNASVNVFEPEPLVIEYTAIDPLIAGFSTGEIHINVTGGVTPYSFDWNPDISSTNSAINLNAGNYQITISDSHGCSDNLSIVLSDPECNASYNLSVTNITHCTAQLNWASVTNSLGYYVRFRENGTSEWTEFYTTQANSQLSGLVPETDYDWEISTICNQAQSAYTSSSFTTIATGNVITHTCKGIFTDTGGALEEYSNYEDYTFTINPQGADKITVWFSILDIETNYDTLFVYDGLNTTAPLITSYQDIYINETTGTQGICISSTGDAITFRFKSDYLTTNPGWYAEWTSYGNACGNNPDTELIDNISNEWATEDFNIEFINTDYSGLGISHSFWQALYLDGNSWQASTSDGFLNDNFIENSGNWNNITGSWDIYDEHLRQTDEANGNTNYYIDINHPSSEPILIHWQMNIEGSGANRRAGLHFMCDDATQTNRNNSYMVYFRADQNTVQLYKYENDVMYLKTSDNTTVNPNQWYDYKILYNPETGEIKAFQDNILVSAWIDDSPLTVGNSLSLRTGNCIAWYDDIKVYKSSSSNETVSIQNHLNNTENSDPATPACRIKSMAMDRLFHFSLLEESEINVDITPPTNIEWVNDGLDNDIDIFSEQSIEANWQHSTDPNSEVSHYEIAVGTSSGNTNISEWSNIGYTNSETIDNITMFTNGLTYYVGIRAVNYAGLTGNETWSNGQTYQAPPVAVFNAEETTICVGESIEFINNSVNATSYAWQFQGGIPSVSNETNPVVIYSEPGIYSVQITVNGPSGSDVLLIEDYINVLANPVAGFTWTGGLVNETTQFTNTSEGASSFLWDFGNYNTSTETNPSYVFTNGGNFEVSLTASNNVCPNDTYTETIVITNIEAYCGNLENLKIYPNPASNNLFVDFSANHKISANIEIINSIGQICTKIENKTIHAGNNKLEIDISKLNSGNYILYIYENSHLNIKAGFTVE
jgi:PKD repeat protein